MEKILPNFQQKYDIYLELIRKYLPEKKIENEIRINEKVTNLSIEKNLEISSLLS